MKAISKKFGLYMFLVMISGIIIYLFMFYFSVNDTLNVKIEGYIFDEETKKPVQNVLILIHNESYEDDQGYNNHDEYLGYEVIKLYSNEKGYYSTTIEKSAFLWIEFYKNEYHKKSEKGQYSRKRMNYKTYLKKK